MSICWYKDDDIGIYFSSYPDISIQYIQPNSSKNDKQKITKKPFKLNNDLMVKIIDYFNNEEFTFNIDSNYTWDGATIP
ncbi:MAG: hypothetical protein IKL52_02235, partial [Candidatus Gastranaerophilales bacterium]|nr:hypothetical protein [Candidatus Gastranaerophilales bacterium]